MELAEPLALPIASRKEERSRDGQQIEWYRSSALTIASIQVSRCRDRVFFRYHPAGRINAYTFRGSQIADVNASGAGEMPWVSIRLGDGKPCVAESVSPFIS